MNSVIDHSTLNWVKQELDETLKQARQALEAYVENPDDAAQLQFCSVHLHQVYGTLQMVELYGASMLAEEMEKLALALLDGKVSQKQEAYELIMRGVLQLPDYLDRLSAGHRDVPLVLLPLLNDLRAIRGESLLSENALFTPDIARPLPESVAGPAVGEDVQAVARARRHQYQVGLLGWFREQDVSGSLSAMAEVLAVLRDASSRHELRRLWWVAGAVVEALREDLLDASMASKLLLGQVDRQIKALIDQGEAALADAVPADLLKNLLFYVARASRGAPEVDRVKDTFGLDALLPDQDEISAAEQSLSGHNQELMATVSAAIKEDMAHVKDTLDLFMRGGRKAVADLGPAAEMLERIGDTLGMLGLGALRKKVQEQAALAADMVAGRCEPEEDRLMGIAGALLAVESALDGIQSGALEESELAEESSVAADQVPDAEFNQVRAVVADEAIRDIARAKEAIVSFIGNPQDLSPLEMVPQWFHQIKGGLLLLNETRAAGQLDAVTDFVANRVIEPRAVPEQEALDHLADAISGIEYYLENLRESKVLGGDILDVVQNSLDALGVAAAGPADEADAASAEVAGHASVEGEETGGEAMPAIEMETLELPEEDGGPELEAIDPGEFEIPAEAEDTGEVEPRGELVVEDLGEFEAELPEPGEAAIEDLGEFEVEEVEIQAVDETEAPIELPETEAVAETPEEDYPFPVLDGGEVDEEILEIFLEEAQEEVANIGETLPAWVANAEDQEALTSMRRSFHTLKGSGRLVGAMLIGEFAWAFENMLNRVIDGTVERNDSLCRLLELANEALPQLVEQLQSRRRPTSDIMGLMARAEAYARGETISFDDLRTAEPVPAEVIPLRAEEAGTAAEAAEPAIDPVLYDIFSRESAEHLAAIRDWLARNDAGRGEVDEALIRALHTLHGSAHMAGATAIADIAAEFERYAKALNAERLYMPADGHRALAQLVEQVEAILPLYAGVAPELPDVQPLITRIAGLVRTPDLLESLPAGEIELSEAVVEETPPGEPLVEVEAGPVDAGADLPETGAMPELSEPVEIEPEAVTRDEDGMTVETVELDDVPVEMEMAGAETEVVEIQAEPVEPGGEDAGAEAIEPEAEPVELEAESEAEADAGDEGPDEELIEVFLEEGDEILESSEATLQAWMDAPDDRDLMAALQRDLHTLKGGARMSDLTEIGDLSHHLESLLIAADEGQVQPSQGLFDLLHAAHDRLVHQVEAVKARQPVPPAQDLIEQIEALRRGETPRVPASTTEPAAEEVSELEAAVAAAAVPEVPREERAAPAEKEKQELVRVRADLLDDMVNYAGEISIYRARLEQQVGSYRFNLSELGQTVDRLREQLRKMEIETEAQVLYRYEREGIDGSDQEDFDPLEMDRYSTLQTLSRAMMESIGDLVSIQNLLENITRESETLLVQQARVNTELQEGLMRTRMVPFSGLAPRMRRIVRQACQELGKRAELVIEGAEGEMDRTVIDRIIAPIEHMLRNAVAHGIESPEERKARGKRPTGTITVALKREGSDVVITLSDDGAGLNLEAIRRKARERGLLEDDAAFTDNEIMQFVLETGFSTAEEVSQIAGRGVGMDVVNSEVKQLGGSLHIDSTAGQGTRFTVRLPFTLAINQALLVQVHEDIYAIPLTGIEGVVRMSQEELEGFYADPERRFEYAGHEYEVRHLGEMLGQGRAVLGSGAPKRLPVLLVRAGDHHMALQVEALLGSRETVVKSVGPQISTVRGISGATILGDGRVVLILDLAGLVRGGVVLNVARAEAPPAAEPERTQPLVMVVDDSITVRKVTTRLLERNDMQVITAKDGVDAVAQLQEHIPDVMLLDIEMPRMDGFELATHIRNEPRLRDIPIIMITSRTGEKHRNRAMEIGVDRYLGKPYQESDLLDNIAELIAARKQHG